MAPRMFADMNVDELIEARQRLVRRANQGTLFERETDEREIWEAVSGIDAEVERREHGQPTPAPTHSRGSDMEFVGTEMGAEIERLEAQVKHWSTANMKIIARLTEVERENAKLKEEAIPLTIPGERFAKAANELIGGIMKIQFTVHRPLVSDSDNEEFRQLMMERNAIAEICERLVGPYKIIIADLTQG